MEQDHDVRLRRERQRVARLRLPPYPRLSGVHVDPEAELARQGRRAVPARVVDEDELVCEAGRDRAHRALKRQLRLIGGHRDHHLGRAGSVPDAGEGSGTSRGIVGSTPHIPRPPGPCVLSRPAEFDVREAALARHAGLNPVVRAVEARVNRRAVGEEFMVRQLPEVRSMLTGWSNAFLGSKRVQVATITRWPCASSGSSPCAIRQLASSLWLDETGTFMVIRGSLNDVVDQGLEIQGQFPLYHAFLWCWSRLAGTSEIALRLLRPCSVHSSPPGCATGSPCDSFTDVIVARLAAYVFVLLPPVAFSGPQCPDPTPLAFAALVVPKTVVLFRWMESRQLNDILYVGLIALTLYLDYMFALAACPRLCRLSTCTAESRRGAITVAVVPNRGHRAAHAPDDPALHRCDRTS